MVVMAKVCKFTEKRIHVRDFCGKCVNFAIVDCADVVERVFIRVFLDEIAVRIYGIRGAIVAPLIP